MSVPTESEQYRNARNELHEAEVALREARIRAAALRRALPLDTEVEDYCSRRRPVERCACPSSSARAAR